jgi:hypothetical protein
MNQKARSMVHQGHRSFNRLRLGLPASLVLTHERRSCVLENISAAGACVRCEEPVPKGTTTVLCFHLLRAYAIAIWSRENLCGLRFDKLLELEDMQGFLWITQNREEYERICREELLKDSSTGFGR